MELSPSPAEATPNHVRSIDKRRAADWSRAPAWPRRRCHLDSLAAALSHTRRRRESAPSLLQGISSPARKIPRDFIDGGITIWCWIIHFCSTSNAMSLMPSIVSHSGGFTLPQRKRRCNGY
ncbi:hypothetical protein VPH35_001657 [Triticum aestivum]